MKDLETKVARIDGDLWGKSTLSVIQTPCYLLSDSPQEVVVDFDFIFKKGGSDNGLILCYRTDKSDIQELLHLPKEKYRKHTQAVIPQAKLAGAKYLQILWVYVAHWADYAELDNIAIYEKQTPTKAHTLSYRAMPEGAATFRNAGKEISKQEVEHEQIPKMVHVMPSPGYRFIAWANGSASNPYRYALPALQDEEFVASLIPEDQVLASYVVAPSGGRVMRGEEELQEEKLKRGVESASIVAVPQEGYRFVQWSDNGSTEAKRTVKIAEDTRIVAFFAKLTTRMHISVSAEGRPVEHATVSIGGQYTYTDNRGLAVVDLEEGEHDLVVLAEDAHLPYIRRVEVKGERMSETVNLQRDEAQGVVFILSHRGKRMPGVSVKLGGNTIVTNESGLVRFALPEGTYSYGVTPAGFAPARGTIQLKAAQREVVKIELRAIYSVVFNFNDGSGTRATQQILEGEILKAPAELQREGKRFDGWFVDGVKYDFSQPVTRAFTLEAKWTDVQSTPTPVHQSTHSTLTLAPNPVVRMLRIEGLPQAAEARVYSAAGECILTTRVSPGGMIDFSRLPAGVYLIRILGQVHRIVKL